jgi:hypothetical protein
MTNTRRILTGAMLGATLLSARPAIAQTSWGLGVTRGGSIVFCDRVRSTVWQVDPDGSRHAALAGENCHAIATGLDGQVLGEATPMDVTTTRGVGVWRLNPAGQREWLQPPNLVDIPRAWVARDAQSRSYIWTGVGAGSAQSSIIRLDPSGVKLALAGGARGNRDGIETSAQFDNVTGLAAAPDGSLLVLDNGNVRRVSDGGRVVTEAVGVATDSHIGLVNMPGLWAREIGIAADQHSEAIIVDPAAGRVIHVDRGGHAVTMWAPSGWSQRLTGGRWGWRPSGVASLGRTYYVVDEWVGPALIADMIGSPRVMQVDDQGRVTRIASVPGWSVRIGSGLFLIVILSYLFRRRKPAAR